MKLSQVVLLAEAAARAENLAHARLIIGVNLATNGKSSQIKGEIKRLAAGPKTETRRTVQVPLDQVINRNKRQ